MENLPQFVYQVPMERSSGPIFMTILKNNENVSKNTEAKPQVVLNISSDALLLLAIITWALWDKVMKPSVVDKLDGVFAPVEEERKLNNILAQIGIITGASRVVLAAFHNGALDSEGYHLQKLSTVNTYVSPGHIPMAYPIKDLPIGRIMFEIETMLNAADPDGWVVTRYSDDLPQPCKDHLLKNSIYKMANRLVRVGNLPIGILSLQYEDEKHAFERLVEDAHHILMEDLYQQISAIMRRRIIHPSPIHKFFMGLANQFGLRK